MKPGYKQTEVGVIPEEWKVESVGDAYEIRNQLRLPISQSVRERMEGPYPYYGPTNVQSWINEYRIEGEHALIGEDGDHFLKWRDQAMTLLVTGKFNVNNHAHVVRGTKNLTAWFYWFFANRDICTYLTRQGASRYKLTKTTLQQLPCAVPPLHEQRTIATALSDVDALLAALDRLIAKKRDLKQAAMQQLLTGQTRLPGCKGKWLVKRLGDVGTCIRGVSYQGDSDLSPHDMAHTKRLLRSNNVQESTIVISNVQFVNAARVSEKQILRKNDILICMANGSKALVGKAGIFSLDDGYIYTFGAFMGCFRNYSDTSCSAFVFYLFQTGRYRDYINNLLAGSSINNLSPGSIESLEFLMPPLPEQTAIATVLSDMDAELATMEQRLNKTRALKQGMMQELLTGRTRLVASPQQGGRA